MSSAWDQDWDEDPPTRSGRGVALAIAILMIASVVVTWFAFARIRHQSPDPSTAPLAAAAPSLDAEAGRTPSSASATVASTAAPTASTTVAEESTTSTSVAPTTTATATTVKTTAPPPPADPAASPVTLPDGSPVPVLAVFDVDRITLSGAVPSEAARERLKGLALANSKAPVPLVDLLVIDPSVPLGVPVRVIEKTSTRFPSGSAEISPDHALELDRVANVMNFLPNITVVVIGHADQRGDEATNFALSEARAQAVTAYLASKGVAPSRLAARAVGEDDLLSLNDDAAALALNRRTEFVFTGLLVGS